jgi:hypothetical protein
MAPSPLAGRIGALSVWTGNQLFIWGGGVKGEQVGNGGAPLHDGALYDPKSDSWRTITSPPEPILVAVGGLEFGHGGTVWTGDEVLLVRGEATAFAYRLSTDSWQGTAPMPTSEYNIEGSVQLFVVNDGTVYAWESWMPNCSYDCRRTAINVYEFNETQNHWTALSLPPRQQPTDEPCRVGSPYWTGGHFLFGEVLRCLPDGNPVRTGYNLLHSVFWNPSNTAWNAIPESPVVTNDDLNPGASAWTGSAMIVANTYDGSFTSFHAGDLAFGKAEAFLHWLPLNGTGGPSNGNWLCVCDVLDALAAAYDPATGSWTRLPTAPGHVDQAKAFWAGDRLILWSIAGGYVLGP